MVAEMAKKRNEKPHPSRQVLEPRCQIDARACSSLLWGRSDAQASPILCVIPYLLSQSSALRVLCQRGRIHLPVIGPIAKRICPSLRMESRTRMPQPDVDMRAHAGKTRALARWEINQSQGSPDGGRCRRKFSSNPVAFGCRGCLQSWPWADRRPPVQVET
jgi:hypothetical protein